MALVRSFVKFFFVALAACLAVSSASAQDAGWKLCNNTSYILDAATGRPEGTGITVDGWVKIQPGQCRIAVGAPLQTNYHFVYARSSEAHRGGRREWGGKTPLCIDTTGGFSIESPPDCATMGLETRTFRAVKIENASGWTTRFEETERFSADTARAAGLQRLLEEAGVVAGVIDGNLGNKTRTAIQSFLKENGLPPQTSDADLIDFLEQVAKERGRNIGFTLCNRTKSRIWSAIARRGIEGWESRGWWSIEAGGCARVIDKPLRTSDHFVYAEMEEGTGVRTLSRASIPFCVGRAKFAIVGREDCEQSAYRTAMFAAAPAPVDRKIIYEFFERDFAKAPAK